MLRKNGLPHNIMADKCKIDYMLFCIVFLNFWKKKYNMC